MQMDQIRHMEACVLCLFICDTNVHVHLNKINKCCGNLEKFFI